jgi:hypothetical protein
VLGDGSKVEGVGFGMENGGKIGCKTEVMNRLVGKFILR